MNAVHPHGGQPVLHDGEPLEQARAAMLLAHGRGASARDILTVAQELMMPGWAYLAPQAAGGTWYPNRFSEPLESNEPWLSSALRVLDELLRRVGQQVPTERVILLGFSQGACLTLEFAARSGRRYGGIAGLTGALVGPEGTPRDYGGSLDGTPVFLGSSDVDPHVPLHRVDETAEVLRRLGGEVTERIYPGMGHTINGDELEHVRTMAAGVSSLASASESTN